MGKLDEKRRHSFCRNSELGGTRAEVVGTLKVRSAMSAALFGPGPTESSREVGE